MRTMGLHQYITLFRWMSFCVVTSKMNVSVPTRSFWNVKLHCCRCSVTTWLLQRLITTVMTSEQSIQRRAIKFSHISTLHSCTIALIEWLRHQSRAPAPLVEGVENRGIREDKLLRTHTPTDSQTLRCLTGDCNTIIIHNGKLHGDVRLNADDTTFICVEYCNRVNACVRQSNHVYVSMRRQIKSDDAISVTTVSTPLNDASLHLIYETPKLWSFLFVLIFQHLGTCIDTILKRRPFRH